MDIQQNISLRNYSTMKLGGDARYLVEVTSTDQLIEALTWAEQNHQKPIMIGIGSNIIWSDEGYPGLVIVNKIMGFDIVEGQNTRTTQFKFGSGENWDSMVRRTVELGYSGLEQLSLIPGTVGGTPVQNVGAYGREIKDVLVSVQAYDTEIKAIIDLSPEDCQFGYRTSRFKTTDKSRFFITSLTVRLTKTNPQPPFYASLQAQLDKSGVTAYTPAVIREAVIAVRTSKLPDPARIANNGSFFANPIVSKDQFDRITTDNPDIAHWSLDDGRVKLSAAWLVEHAGFRRGYIDHETGMGLWKDQALVLVNEHAKSTQDLLAFKHKIVSAVQSKFDVSLQQEPEVI